MTKEGKAYLSIIGVIFVVATVWTLWKVFLGVALIVLAIGLLVGACYVWRYVHALMLADREDVAQVERQEAAAERARADAALRWVEVEAARARVDLIPAGYDGVRLKRPEEAVLFYTWNFRQERSPNLARVEPEPVLEALPTPPLPGYTDLAQMLASFRPSPAQILLALTERGPLYCSLEGVSHVALASPTGGGKSSVMRLLLAQILACQAVVWLADPHFTPIDPKSGEDWRPIATRLAAAPFTQPEAIKDAIEGLVREMRRRYAIRSAGRTWTPCYLAVDEWPSILARLDKRSGEELVSAASELLREGRKVDVNVITSSQDYLVETIGSSGEIRANLRTAYFAGGGLATARALLDQQIKLPDVALGKGIVLLRSEEAQPKPALVRVPYASNEALYRLLPPGQGVAFPMPPLPPLVMKHPVSPPPTLETESALEAGQTASSGGRGKRQLVTEAERQEILEYAAKGLSPAGIATAMHRRNAFADIVRLVLQEQDA